jgi:hypothetical protein
MHTGFWWGNLKERDHLEDLGLDRMIILKCILTFKCRNGQICPSLCVVMSAKTDIFVQKYVCRLFALNTMAGQYACVNAMHTYYKL